MMLYHFTSLQNHWAIQRDQEIRTTESNIGSGRPDMPPFGEHVGHDVVWLTTRESPKRNGLEHPPGALVHHAKATGRPAIEWDKTRIRITVDLPANEVARWSVWSKRYRMHPKWRKARLHKDPRQRHIHCGITSARTSPVDDHRTFWTDHHIEWV